MTIYVYDDRKRNGGETEYHSVRLAESELLPSKPKMDVPTRVTVKEGFYREEGFDFQPGRYGGEGFEATITTPYVHNASSHSTTPEWKTRQDLFGKFDSWEHMRTFWELLRGGELLPIVPVSVKLDLRTEDYARQAARAVGLFARVTLLETALVQMQNHLTHQANLIQGLLASKK